MNKEELKYYLEILVENILSDSLRILKKNITQEELEKEQQKSIINFINGLDKEYKDLPNRDEIIINTLDKMGMSTLWSQKKKEEIESLSKNKIKINQSNTIKTSEENTLEL